MLLYMKCEFFPDSNEKKEGPKEQFPTKDLKNRIVHLER